MHALNFDALWYTPHPHSHALDDRILQPLEFGRADGAGQLEVRGLLKVVKLPHRGEHARIALALSTAARYQAPV